MHFCITRKKTIGCNRAIIFVLAFVGIKYGFEIMYGTRGVIYTIAKAIDFKRVWGMIYSTLNYFYMLFYGF